MTETNRDRRLTRNSARCLRCGDEIESVSSHDFRQCTCGTVTVDGGKAYWRRVYKEEENVGWVDTSIFEGDE